MAIYKNSALLIFFFLFCSFCTSSLGQTEYANIELDNSLIPVEDIQQVSNAKGNTVIVFQNRKHLQFSLIAPGGKSTSQHFKTKRRLTLIESFYNEPHFYFYYQEKNKGSIYLYKTEEHTLSDQLEKILSSNKAEKPLSEIVFQDQFLAFKYSKKPYTIHTYRHENGVEITKKSQAFDNHKKESFFVGRMVNAIEFISVRMTLNPLTYHFYRYHKEGNFEKKSIQLRPLYELLEIKGRHAMPETDFLSPITNLNFYIENEELYLDLGQLITINNLQKNRTRPTGGVLRFNWRTEDAEILMAKQTPNWKYKGRSFMMHDSLYFDLATSKERLSLSIYNIKNQKLLNNYSYTVDEDIDLIHGQPQVTSTSTMYMDLFSEASVPIKVKDKTYDSISNKDLLKTLSGEELYLDVFSDDSILELQISGANYEDYVFEKRESVSFSSFLKKTNLDIIDESEFPDNSRWEKVDNLIDTLLEHQKDLGLYISYEAGGRLYLIYTIKNKNEARLIQL